MPLTKVITTEKEETCAHCRAKIKANTLAYKVGWDLLDSLRCMREYVIAHIGKN